MTFSKIFFYFCLFFILGVGLTSFFDPGLFIYFLILILSLLIIVVFYPYTKDFSVGIYKRKIATFGTCLLVLLLGMFWEEKFEKEIIPYCGADSCDIHFFNEKGEIIFEGLISEEPKEKMRSTQIIVKGERIIEAEDKHCTKADLVRGKVLIFLSSDSFFQYGDRVRVKGDLKTPKNFTEDFNYKEYLRKDRIYSVVYSPKIKLVSSGNGNIFFRKIFSFKEKLKKTAKVLPPPEGAILSAMTLGDKSRLSQDFKDKLSRAGLSHITAISGMHIMVLFGILLFVFFKLGLWRWQATILTILFLIFYILMIGAPPSAVRAGIMGGLLYLGYMLGRLNQSSRAVVFAATGMIVINPLILTRDAGFQLSFLASLGIIYLLPIFSKWTKAEGSKIKELLGLTFAAQIFCFPILIFNFGQFPILAPISNLLVVPLLPYLLGIGFLFLIIGVIFSILAFPFSFILWFPFAWITKVADFISSIPFSSISLNLHWGIILIFYIVLGWFVFVQGKKRFCE